MKQSHCASAASGAAEAVPSMRLLQDSSYSCLASIWSYYEQDNANRSLLHPYKTSIPFQDLSLQVWKFQCEPFWSVKFRKIFVSEESG